MTDPSDASQDLVLYGLDDKAKPRAGLVAAAEAEAARVIAAGLNFQLRPISTAQQRVASITPWEEIKIGQVVLAQEDNPKDGWWEAIVLNELDEGEFLLRYRDYSPQYRFVRRGEQLALLKPA
jgi:hypothetical protein